MRARVVAQLFYNLSWNLKQFLLQLQLTVWVCGYKPKLIPVATPKDRTNMLVGYPRQYYDKLFDFNIRDVHRKLWALYTERFLMSIT